MAKNKLEVLFDRLREEGWYCGWAELCCQSCAWACLPYEHEVGPFKGKPIDFDKCLFNHEQDCCLDEDDWEGDEDDFYDMLENYDVPVVLDATHAVQKPGGQGDSSGGNRNYVPGLTRAGAALGIKSCFMVVHADPDLAPID